MLPQILAALGEAAGIGGAAGAAGKAGSEMFWDAASGSVKSRGTPPPLPGQSKSRGTPPPLPGQSKGGGFMDGLGDSIMKGNLAAQAFSKGIEKVGEVVNAVTHPFETLEQGLKRFPGLILKAKESITSTATMWVEALAAPIKTVKELGDSVAQFVRLSNPALVKMFEYRVENTFATIGHTLEPILQALTRSAETVGDAFAKLQPELDPIGEILGGIIDDLSQGIVPAAKELTPWIKMAAEQMRLLAFNAKMVIGPMLLLQDVLGTIPKLLYGGGFDESKKSGVAAREPRYYSGAEDFAREQAKRSLQASYGGGKQETTESLLDKIYNYVSKQLVPDMKQAVIEAIEKLREHLPETPGILRDPGSWLERRADANLGPAWTIGKGIVEDFG